MHKKNLFFSNKILGGGVIALFCLLIAACISVCFAFGANAADGDASSQTNATEHPDVKFYLKYDGYLGDTPSGWSQETIDGVKYFTYTYKYEYDEYATWSEVKADIIGSSTAGTTGAFKSCLFYDTNNLHHCYYDINPCTALIGGINTNGMESNTATITYQYGNATTLDIHNGDTAENYKYYSYYPDLPEVWTKKTDGNLVTYACSDGNVQTFCDASLNIDGFVYEKDGSYNNGSCFSTGDDCIKVKYHDEASTVAVKVSTDIDSTGVGITDYTFTSDNSTEGWIAKRRGSDVDSPYDFYNFYFATNISYSDVQTSFAKAVNTTKSIIDANYSSTSPKVLSSSGFSGEDKLTAGMTEKTAQFSDIGRITLNYKDLYTISTPTNDDNWINTSNGSYVRYITAAEAVESDLISNINKVFNTDTKITKKNADDKIGSLVTDGISLNNFKKSEICYVTVAFTFKYPHDVKLALNGGSYTETGGDVASSEWKKSGSYYVKEFYEGDSAEAVINDINAIFEPAGFIKYDSKNKPYVLDSTTPFFAKGSWTVIETTTGVDYIIDTNWVEGVKFSIKLGDNASLNSSSLPTGWYCDDGSLYTYQFADQTTASDIQRKLHNNFDDYSNYFQQKYFHAEDPDTPYYRSLTSDSEDLKKPWLFADGFTKLDKEHADKNFCTCVYADKTMAQVMLTGMSTDSVYLSEADSKVLKDAGWIFGKESKAALNDSDVEVSSATKEYEVGTPTSVITEELEGLNYGKGLDWYIKKSGSRDNNYVFDNDYMSFGSTVSNTSFVNLYTQANVLTFKFDYKPTLSGKITSSSTNAAIANAKVVFSCASGTFFSNEFSTTTKTDGTFNFSPNFGNGFTLNALSNWNGMESIMGATTLDITSLRIDIVPADGSNYAAKSIRLDQSYTEDALNFTLDATAAESINVRVDTQELLYTLSSLISKYGDAYWGMLKAEMLDGFSDMGSYLSFLKNYSFDDLMTMYPYVKDYTTVADGDEPTGRPLHTAQENNSYINVPSTAYYQFKQADSTATQEEDRYFQTLVIYDKNPTKYADAKKLYKYYINVRTFVNDFVHFNSTCNMMVLKNNTEALNNYKADEAGVISQGALSAGDSFVLDYTGPVKQALFNDEFYNIIFTTGSTNVPYVGDMTVFVNESQATVSGGQANLINLSTDVHINTSIVNFLYPGFFANLFNIDGVNNRNFTLTMNTDGSIDVAFYISAKDMKITLPSSTGYSITGEVGINLHMAPQTTTNANEYGYNINGLHIPSDGTKYNLFDNTSLFGDQTTMLCKLDSNTTISGKVYDSELGNTVGLPGVAVASTTVDNPSNPSQDTDTSYTVSASDVTSPTTLGDYSLDVFKNKYAALNANIDIEQYKITALSGYEEYKSTTPVSTESEKTVDIPLTPKHTAVSGYVFDSEGVAVEGATVTFTSALQTQYPVIVPITVTTDAEGKYDLASIRRALGPIANSGVVTITKDGYKTVTITLTGDDFSGDTKDLGTSLLFGNDDVIYIKGIVSSYTSSGDDASNKSPEQGVTATLTYGDQTATATTDAKGAYTFTGIPKRSEGKITFHKDNMQDDVVFDFDQDMSTKNIFAETVMLAKATTQVKISGKVTSKNTGEAITNAKINFQINSDSNDNQAFSAVTDNEGNYLQYVVKNKDTDLSTSATGYQTNEQTIEGSEITTDLTHDIQLSNAEVEVSGTIKDTSGNPVSGATVTFVDDNGATRTATTDANGHFTMNIEGGVGGTFTITKDGYSTVTKTITAAEAVAGEITFEAMVPNPSPQPEPGPSPTPTPDNGSDGTAATSSSDIAQTGDNATVPYAVMMLVVLSGLGIGASRVVSRKNK